MTKHLKITVEGKVYDVIVEDVTEDAGSTFYPQPGMTMPSTAAPAAAAPARAAPAPAAPSAGAADQVAPLGGVIVEIAVKEGDKVNPGDKVAVIEAMKMKQLVVASHGGTVTKVHVKVGEAVDSGQPLMTIA
jgi:glutaconyl-CoA/methylmalonyl-CoA decarboxylase subunit gamma